MDKSEHDDENFPPLQRRNFVFSPPNNSCNVNSEPSELPNLPPLGAGGSSKQGNSGNRTPSDSCQFSHDINRMPDNPTKNLGHRRAHSEVLTLLDDLNFDNDLGVIGEFDGPLSDEADEDVLPMYLDMDKFISTSTTSQLQVGELSTSAAVGSPTSMALPQSKPPALCEKPRIRHEHSQSMDGTTTKPETLLSSSKDPSAADKKAISATKLAELALIDPKRAKKIWANRQAAARSKERKMRYIAELESKMQNLQVGATSLSAQLNLLQRDTNGLASENGDLKMKLRAMEQQVHLQDATNDALKEEIQYLKVLTGQAIPSIGPMMNIPTSYGLPNQPYYPNNHAVQVNAQLHQLQSQPPNQQQQQHEFQPRQLHQFQPQQLMHPVPQPSMHQKEQRT